MGDGEKTFLKLNFDSKVRLEFRGATITSDAGLLACRDLDDALSLTDFADDFLEESRTGKNILHKLIPLLRQSIYSRLAGYDDTNDADRLSQDPAMRVVVGWKGPDRNAASTSEMSRFETELLTQKDNLKGLERLNVEWVKRAMTNTVHRRVILDIDSSESPVHGNQEEAAYNGHFECVCYHPLFCFNQFGDCEGAVLRPGNVHSADGWKEFIDPIVERYLKLAVRLLFRADAAFAKPELYDYLKAHRMTGRWREDVIRDVVAHEAVKLPDGRLDMKWSPDSMKWSEREGDYLDLKPIFRRLDIPILFISSEGRADGFVELDPVMAELPDFSMLKIRNTEHNMYMNRPDAISWAINAFVQGQEVSGTI